MVANLNAAAAVKATATDSAKDGTCMVSSHLLRII
jgi:hypothetical protein